MLLSGGEQASYGTELGGGLIHYHLKGTVRMQNQFPFALLSLERHRVTRYELAFALINCRECI